MSGFHENWDSNVYQLINFHRPQKSSTVLNLLKFLSSRVLSFYKPLSYENCVIILESIFLASTYARNKPSVLKFVGHYT